MKLDRRTRWLALYVLCLGDLMIVLDATIVNVALPSIRADLGFTEESLAWVVNAYLLTFGGFLLLGGRLGDLFGHRRLFLGGIALFTLASLACGLSTSQHLLIAARAVQGLGGAVVSAVALSLLLLLFQEPGERTKAMGFFGFVMAGGGSIGVLLGGVLTDVLSWHWIFLVNIPVGIAVFALSLPLLPADSKGERARGPIDVAGAVTVTSALIARRLRDRERQRQRLALGRDARPARRRRSSCSASSSRSSRASAAPLVPLRLFKLRNLSVANGVGVLWSAGMFAWFFFAAQYLGLVLGYDPLHVGLAFLPANIIMGAFSLGLSARIVMRFGTRLPIGDRDGARLARAAAVRARARGRELLARRAADDDRPRHRRRDGDEPGADRGDERRRAERVRPGLRRSSTPPS